MENTIQASRNAAVLEKRDGTPAVNDVNVETPVEPCKSNRMTNKVRIELFVSQPSTAAQPPRLKTKLDQTPGERKMVEKVCPKPSTPSQFIIAL